MKRQSLVIWNDAHANLDEVSESDILAAHRPHVIHTYGYVVRSDDTGVSIAGEWLPAGNGADETYRSVTFVPRGMVVEVRPSRARKPKAAPTP